jgi:hypothetical protein
MNARRYEMATNIFKLGTCHKCGSTGINVLLGYCVVCGARTTGEPDCPEIDEETGDFVDTGDQDRNCDFSEVVDDPA